MKFYSKDNKPITEDEIEIIKKSPEYRKKIKEDLEIVNNGIEKLVLDRDKSDKIIGLVIGTEISCFLTMITDMIGVTQPNDDYSVIRIIILVSSIIIRNINLISNHIRKIKIYTLNSIKEDIIKENDWLDNQKSLKY